MSCELGDLPAKFPDAGTLVRELKSCADWRWKPSRGRGESAHTSLLNSVSHLVWQLVFHEMRPIQEFQVNIAPFTGTTNAVSWDLALSLGRHQKHSFLLCNHNSLLRATHFLTGFFFFPSSLRKKLRARVCGLQHPRIYCWQRKPQSWPG